MKSYLDYQHIQEFFEQRNGTDNMYDDNNLKYALSYIETELKKILNEIPIYCNWYVLETLNTKRHVINSFSKVKYMDFIEQSSNGHYKPKNEEEFQLFLLEMKAEISNKLNVRCSKNKLLELEPTRECMLDVLSSLCSDYKRLSKVMEENPHDELRKMENKDKINISHKITYLKAKLSDENLNLILISRIYALLDVNKKIKHKVAEDMMINSGYVDGILNKIIKSDSYLDYSQLKSIITEKVYKAVDKFSIYDDIKFTTYLYNWIYNGFQTWVTESNNFFKKSYNLNRHYSKVISHIKSLDDYELTNGNIRRIADECNCDENDVVNIYNMYKIPSIDMELEKDSGHTLDEILSDELEEDEQISNVCRNELSRKILDIVEKNEFDNDEKYVAFDILEIENKKQNKIPRHRYKKAEKSLVKKLDKYINIDDYI